MNYASLPASVRENFTKSNSAADATEQESLWGAKFSVLKLKDNELVFREGEIPQGLYYLKSGSLKAVVNRPISRGRMSSPEFITKIVGPGEFFGYKSVVSQHNYSFFVKTLQASEIHLFSRSIVDDVMAGPDTLFKALLKQSVHDLEAFEKVSQMHYLASVQERIAFQIVLLAEKFGVETPGGISLNIRLTRNELAQLAGTINESLSRHLTEFKSEGLVDLDGREIIVKNIQGLREKAGNFAQV